jgi:flagellar motility protein MotE (MotC chaperone)
MNDEILKELKFNGAMLEEIRDQNKALLEGQKDQANRADIRRLGQDIAELKDDMKVVKAAVKATNHDLTKHVSQPAHVAHGHA